MDLEALKAKFFASGGSVTSLPSQSNPTPRRNHRNMIEKPNDWRKAVKPDKDVTYMKLVRVMISPATSQDFFILESQGHFKKQNVYSYKEALRIKELVLEYHSECQKQIMDRNPDWLISEADICKEAGHRGVSIITQTRKLKTLPNPARIVRTKHLYSKDDAIKILKVLEGV